MEPALTTARTMKPRAQDMDESLHLTQQMREHIEQLTARQNAALSKMKDSKGAVKKLREQVATMQQQLDSVQSEQATSLKATDDLKGQLEKMENEYAVLHATHTWTKSSLDSALAAQEEYRKGYNSLRAAFKKAKEDLEKVSEELNSATTKAAQEELRKAYAVLDENKAVWDAELNTVNATMQKIAHKHKDKSKKVLDRMLAGQASGLMGTCFQAWIMYLKDWKNSAKAQADVAAAQAKLNDFQSKKNEEAKQFLNRMSAASDSGLVSVAFKAWLAACADTLKERKEAEAMSSQMKNQKMEARKRLEATLGASAKGLQGLIFKNWSQNWREEKEERELKAKADEVLKDYQKKKRSEAMGVVGRMAQKKENALLSQIVLVWNIVTRSEVAGRVRDEQSRNRLTTIGKEIEEAKKVLAAKQEELADVKDELQTIQSKNQVIADQLSNIIELEESMEEAQRQMEADDDV